MHEGKLIQNIISHNAGNDASSEKYIISHINHYMCLLVRQLIMATEAKAVIFYCCIIFFFKIPSSSLCVSFLLWLLQKVLGRHSVFPLSSCCFSYSLALHVSCSYAAYRG